MNEIFDRTSNVNFDRTSEAVGLQNLRKNVNELEKTTKESNLKNTVKIVLIAAAIIIGVGLIIAGTIATHGLLPLILQGSGVATLVMGPVGVILCKK